MTVAPHDIDPARFLEDHLAQASPDLLREMLGTFINQLLSADADQVCGAAYGTISDDRVNRRNGYRTRGFDTRAGTIDVKIPKLRQGTYFPEWLLERRRRVDAAAHAVDDAPKWDGTWELAIVSMDRRSPADRLTLRKAATALHLAELREGVWIRPDNLDPDRLPGMRAVLDRQCVHFHHAATDVPVQLARDLFRLPDWAADARRLTEALTDEMDVDAVDATGFTYQFALSIAVVRHLQFDPLLPAELAPDDWPGPALRAAYRSFEETFKRRLYNAFR